MLTRRLSTASLASCRARVQLSSRSGLSTLRLGLAPPRSGLSTVVAPPPPPPPAAAAPPEEEDARPFVVRWWKSILFWSFVASWAYSLIQQNRSRRGLDEEEERVRACAPVNADEILELRALNDVSSDTLATLADVAGAGARHDGATVPQVLAALAKAVGQPVREEYALERMLLAVLEVRGAALASPAEAAAPRIPLDDAALALGFLSNGPVVERLGALYASASGGGPGPISAERFVAALGVLAASGQVPPDKQVALDGVGRNALGVDRSWYVEQPAVSYSAAELADAAAAELAAEGTAPPPAWWQFWKASEGAVADAARAKGGGGAAGGLPPTVDRPTFERLLVSDAVCLWGECHLIRERERIAKRRAEAEEYERSPPSWQFWKWGRS